MRGIIREATSTDAEAVTALRQAEYSGSTEFTLLSPASLAWGPDDELGVVLVAVSADGAVASTMRGRVFESVGVFERSSGLDLSSVELPTPTLFLDRASTRADARRNGLNALLRYYFLQAAVDYGFPSVGGWLFSGVSRTKTMAEIGYTFTSVRAVQPRGYRHMESAEREYVVAVLPQARIPTARSRLEERLGDELQRWRWVGLGLRRPGVVA